MSEDQSQQPVDEPKTETPSVPAYVPDPARAAHLNQLHRRGMAFFIDFTIYGLTLFQVLMFYLDRFPLGPSFPLEEDLSYAPVHQVFGTVLFCLLRAGFRGGSPGQRWLGLKLVDANDETRCPPFHARALRNLSLGFPPGGYILEYLFANGDREHRQRLGDRVWQTRVVNANARGLPYKYSVYVYKLIMVFGFSVIDLARRLWPGDRERLTRVVQVSSKGPLRGGSLYGLMIAFFVGFGVVTNLLFPMAEGLWAMILPG